MVPHVRGETISRSSAGNGRPAPGGARWLLAVTLMGLALALGWSPAASAVSPAASAAECLWSPAFIESSPDAAVVPRGAVGEWTHAVQVLSWLRYEPPERRVVYLLGGSAARESVTSESGWAAQLRKLTGRSATTYVCSTRCQTFIEDELIVNKLPEKRGTVLIGVGTSRFLMHHESRTLPRSSIRRTPPEAWYQHHYDNRTALSYSEKRRLARNWVSERYPVFQAVFQERLAELTKVIEACEARGLRPALVELPLNLEVVGDDFDEALKTYRRACLALAREHGMPYLRFVSSVGLKSADFYDLQHLLPSGRAKWQARLSRQLRYYHLL
jgi:hypothetical protein